MGRNWWKRFNQIFRWVIALPLGWFVAALVLACTKGFSPIFSVFPFSNFVTSRVVVFVGVLFGVYTGSFVFLKILPRYKGLGLCLVSASYLTFQVTHTSRYGVEFFLFILAFLMAAFASYQTTNLRRNRVRN